MGHAFFGIHTRGTSIELAEIEPPVNIRHDHYEIIVVIETRNPKDAAKVAIRHATHILRDTQ